MPREKICAEVFFRLRDFIIKMSHSTFRIDGFFAARLSSRPGFDSFLLDLNCKLVLSTIEKSGGGEGPQSKIESELSSHPIALSLIHEILDIADVNQLLTAKSN